MKNIKILDCTLRDGGRIIDCAFPNDEIRDLSSRLVSAKIDIIEVGFLRDYKKIHYVGNSTFFTNVDQIIPYIDKTKSNSMFVAFIDYGMFDIDSLKPWDGKSIDGIRLGFTKKDYINDKDGIINWITKIKSCGYKIFVQGVNSLNYSDREFLDIVEMINSVHPYCFGIVDTYGAMYSEDVDRLYGLLDRNLLPEICIDFHSHNNYQLSFSLAQEIIRLSENGNRTIIIDSTLGGMGKVAGNLNTELIVDYLIRRKAYDYDLDIILDCYDDYIFKYHANHSWGYSIPALMAGIYKSHPNNVIYLTEKFRLSSKDIGKILSMISPDKRQRYDYDNIEKLYIEYNSESINDSQALERLSKIINKREVTILVPGSSLNTYRGSIDDYIRLNDTFVISVNFVADTPFAYSFFGNQKRYNLLARKRHGRKIIISSNIKPDDNSTDIVVNYNSLIDRGYRFFENSTIMLLNLLKRINVGKISLAGFDGFASDILSNYSDDSFQNDRHANDFDDLNNEISAMLAQYVKTVSEDCDIKFITPSRFEDVVKKSRV